MFCEWNPGVFHNDFFSKHTPKMSEDEAVIVRAFVHGLVGKYPRKLDLFHEAFCHRSVNEKNSYERLECLGDAVLGMIACEYLFKTYKEVNEGVLSRLRMKLVNGSALGEYSKSIDLSSMVRINSSIPTSKNSKIYQDAFEALVGCIYLDMGYSTTYDLCKMLFNEHFSEQRLWQDSNFKDILNKLQKRLHCNVTYEKVAQRGPSHGVTYLVKVTMAHCSAHGEGRTIKSAEQDASYQLLRSLGWTDFRTGDVSHFESILKQFNSNC